jgi:hypothetical protein
LDARNSKSQFRKAKWGWGRYSAEAEVTRAIVATHYFSTAPLFSILISRPSPTINRPIMSSSVRQRGPKSSNETPTAPSPNARVKSEDRYNPFSLIEIGRIITFLFLLSCIASWFVTKKDVFWGHRPPYTRLDYWQALIVSVSQRRCISTLERST